MSVKPKKYIKIICDNAGRIQQSATSGNEVFCVARLPQSCRNESYQKLWMPLTFLLHY